MQIHATCVARHGHAVLLLGPSGAGKSDLAVRLIGRGFVLVADDRVDLDGRLAAPPASLSGLIEVRGLGIVRMPHEAPVPVALVLDLGLRPERHPRPAVDPASGAPLLGFDAHAASAADRAALILDCVLGRLSCVSGGLASG